MMELAVFASVVGGGLLWWGIRNRSRPARFKPRPLVTGPGLEFLFRLRRALPECLVFPQVAATSLLEPLGTGSRRKSALARIVGRRVGYAVFDEEMQLLVVIELDHRPRLTRREAECEAYFVDAGIRTLRFHPKHLPSEARIRASVFPRKRGETTGRREPSFEHDGSIDFTAPPASWRNTAGAQG